jgi:hypothetical protein
MRRYIYYFLRWVTAWDNLLDSIIAVLSFGTRCRIVYRGQMKTEEEIRYKIKFLEKLMKKYEKIMNSKQEITESSLQRHEEAEEVYYECFGEINTLKWVLGEQ